MPTTSSYYNDLEYPTVNEDASTYGTLINTYLDGLLTKLKAISDRVTNAQAQLGNIDRGVNAVTQINNTLAGALGSAELLAGTNTTLLPDPYGGTYTKTTTWPAYTSRLSAFSPPTTQSEAANFNYQGFAAALQTEVNRIEATVTQAEADILQARKDTCRTKKYIEVYETGGTTVKSSEIIFFQVNGIVQYQNRVNYNYYSSSYLSGSRILTVNYTLSSNTNGVTGGDPSQAHQTYITEGMLANGSSTTVYREGWGQQLLPVNSVFMESNSTGGSFPTSANTFQITWYPTSSTYQLKVSGPSVFTFWNSNLTLAISKRRVTEEIVFGTPDLTPCENPNPASIPYFP